MKKRKEKDFKSWGTLRLFLSYYGPHKKLFVLDMFCAVFVSAVDLAFPFFSRKCMQLYLPQDMYKTFFTVMFVFIAAYILRAFLHYLMTYLGHTFGVRVEADMRHDIFCQIQKQSFSYFDKNRTGVLMSRITTDLFEITELAHHGPEDVLIAIVTIIGAFVALSTIEWRLALILFAVVPVFLAFSLFARRRMHNTNVRVKAKTAEINAAIESGVSGIRTAKAFTNEAEEERKFDEANSAFKNSKSAYYKAMGTFMGGMEVAMSLMSVLVITAGGYFIMGGRIDYLDLVTFSLYVSIFITPIRKLSAFMEQLIQGMAGFSRFLQIMRTEPAIQDAPAAEDLSGVRGEIEFDNVTFEYNDGTPVLKNISFKLESGKCLAVVGPSGGGKTTLCQLIPRFYDVTGGAVRVDGKDVRSVTQRSLRQAIGIVQQDVFIFAGTIMENIRYGRPDATDEEVIAAAKRAEIHEEILALQDGYGTYVGERGVMLSGGQKQRISIARIFLKNPPILILDEATSALDSVTEAKIQSAFDMLASGRTSIIIAHRLSTIKNADTIAVIRDEHIVESGSHAELLALDGEYAELIRAQALFSKPAETAVL